MTVEELMDQLSNCNDADAVFIRILTDDGTVTVPASDVVDYGTSIDITGEQ